MILSIIGIVIGLTAIGLFIWFRKDQSMTNDLIEGDFQSMERSYTSLMTNFTNYQVETDRKISELEKRVMSDRRDQDRRMDKMNKSLPSVIGTVVGQIEFAQDKINR